MGKSNAKNNRRFLPVLPPISGFTDSANRATLGKRVGLVTPTH
jgi:hypothetical protein